MTSTQVSQNGDLLTAAQNGEMPGIILNEGAYYYLQDYWYNSNEKYHYWMYLCLYLPVGTTGFVRPANSLGNYIKVKMYGTNSSTFTSLSQIYTNNFVSLDPSTVGLPSSISSSDAGKVLAVNSGGTGYELTTASSGGTTYTAGDNIDITSGVISLDDTIQTNGTDSVYDYAAVYSPMGISIDKENSGTRELHIIANPDSIQLGDDSNGYNTTLTAQDFTATDGSESVALGYNYLTWDDSNTNKTCEWDMNRIQLVDEATGDVYEISINNGQIVLTNTSL